MSDSTAFETLKPTLEAFPEGDMRHPDMPVENAVQEGEVMHTLAELDAEALKATGLDPALLDSLSLAVAALRFTQARWVASLGELQDSTKDWREQQAVARDMRNDLLSTLAFATRKVPNAIKAIHRIRAGASDAHILQDLAALAELGKKYSPYLQAVHFDLAILDQAAQLAESLSPIFARAQVEKGATEAKDWRDRAFTFLRKTMAQILVSAEFAFRKNRDRLNLYYSQYRRRQYNYNAKAKGNNPNNGNNNGQSNAVPEGVNK